MKKWNLQKENYLLITPSKIRLYNEDFKIYNCYNFPYWELEELPTLVKRRKKGVEVIIDTISSFDIETTTYKDGEKDKAFMYLWGFCINGLIVVGRLWSEFIYFLKKVQVTLNLDEHKNLITFIHNASFEFQFVYQFLEREFDGFRFFATSKRKIIYFQVNGFIFKCSYKLTNMSLDKAVKKEKGTKYHKMVGDLDYSKFRTPYTPLTYIEWGYFIGDLLSLYDLIKCKLENENRTLFTLPLTSTGYIREYLRSKTREDKKYYWFFHKFGMTEHFYQMCKDELKGGDTHANRFYQGKIL